MIQKRGCKIPSNPQKDTVELGDVQIRAMKMSKITSDMGSITKEGMFVTGKVETFSKNCRC